LQNISKKAKLDTAEVQRYYASPWHILPDVLKKLDEDTAAAARNEITGENWRDDLFGVLMTRFDFLERHRGALSSLLPALALHPRTTRRAARPFFDGMRRMLALAGAPATPLHVAGFTMLYLSLVEEWKNDETPDLARTMAAADKRLEIFERGCAAIPPAPCAQAARK